MTRITRSTALKIAASELKVSTPTNSTLRSVSSAQRAVESTVAPGRPNATSTTLILKRTSSNLRIELFPTPTAWESWLETNHASQPSGLWLQINKKASPSKSVTYEEAVEIALCFGWIDGQRMSYDAHSFIQRFVPRRTKSIWSKRNVDRVNQLIIEGRMRPSGQAEKILLLQMGAGQGHMPGPRTSRCPMTLLPLWRRMNWQKLRLRGWGRRNDTLFC
jgi:hypothetical protein